MNSHARLLCSVCSVTTSKRGKHMPTTSGKITSKYHVTSCMIKFDKPSRLNSLILGVLLVARKLIQIICTQNIVTSVVSSFRCYSYWILNYYNNNWRSRSNDSNFRDPEFKYRTKTQGSVTQDETLSLGKWLPAFRKDLETSSWMARQSEVE
jgi:hypothetical protein